MLFALLAISMTAAVHVPGDMPKIPSDGNISTPLQHYHGVPTLPVSKWSGWIDLINGNHHRHPVNILTSLKRSHWIDSINGNHHRYSVKPQQPSTEVTCPPTRSLSFYRFRLIAFILSLSFIRSLVLRYSELATDLTARVWKSMAEQERSCDARKTSYFSTTWRPKDLADSAVQGPFLTRHLHLAEVDDAFESGLIGDLGVDQMAYR